MSSPGPQGVSNVVAWWVVVNLGLITLWDVVVLATGFPRATVSYQLYGILQRLPVLYFFMGLAVGHLLVPLVLNGIADGATKAN